MAIPKGLFVPEYEIAKLRAEDSVLEREINERTQRRTEIRRRLEAVDLLAEMAAEKAEKSLPEELKPNGAAEESDSPASDLVENLRKTGQSLKVKEIRQRLAELGHKGKADEKNYVYGLVFRLVKSGKLSKRGPRYRAAPISSPEGETEAVGASARH